MTEAHLQAKGQKIPFTIPDNWDDVTLEQFIALQNEELDDLEVFSILTGLDKEHVKQCSHKSVRFYLSQIENLLKEPLEQEQIQEFELNGKKYIGTNLGEASYGQWQDVTEEYDYVSKGAIERLPYLVAATFIEEGKEYDWSRVEELVTEFMSIPMTKIMAMQAFFLTNGIKLYLDSQNSLSPTTSKTNR